MTDKDIQDLSEQDSIDTDEGNLLSQVPDYLYPGEKAELNELGQTRAPACNHISFPNEMSQDGFCVNCAEERKPHERN